MASAEARVSIVLDASRTLHAGDYGDMRAVDRLTVVELRQAAEDIRAKAEQRDRVADFMEANKLTAISPGDAMRIR